MITWFNCIKKFSTKNFTKTGFKSKHNFSLYFLFCIFRAKDDLKGETDPFKAKV